MKILLMLSVLALSSLAAAATDPCKLLSPGEVGAALGMSGVTAQPPEEADFPTCTFGNEAAGGLSLIVAAPAQKLLQGKSLAHLLQYGDQNGEGGMTFDVLTPLKNLGDEAVGGSSRTDSSDNGVKMVMDGSTLLIRKGDTLMMLMGFSLNKSAPKLSVQSLTNLAKRALLRLH